MALKESEAPRKTVREGHIMSPPFFPHGLRVNASADAYMETLQTVVAKPSWRDSVANGRRPLPMYLPTRFGSIP
ncbi:hypothetical protein ACTXT7_015151 [Hymenolepis weldensis]